MTRLEGERYEEHQHSGGGKQQESLLEARSFAAGDLADDGRAGNETKPTASDSDADSGSGRGLKGRVATDDRQSRGEHRCHSHTSGEDGGPSQIGIFELQHGVGGDGDQDGSAHQRLSRGDIGEERSGDDQASNQEAEGEAEGEDVEGLLFGDALGDQVADEPVPDADFGGDVKEEQKRRKQQARVGEQCGGVRDLELHDSAGLGHFGHAMEGEGNDSEGGGEVAEFEGVTTQEVGGDKGRRDAAEAEEGVEAVEKGLGVVGFNVVDEGVSAGDDDAATDAEDKHGDLNVGEVLGARQGEERQSDEAEAEQEADLFALEVDERALEQGADDEADGLCGGNAAVLPGAEAEALGQIRENTAKHGGDHAVNKDGQYGGHNQHRRVIHKPLQTITDSKEIEGFGPLLQ